MTGESLKCVGQAAYTKTHVQYQAYFPPFYNVYYLSINVFSSSSSFSPFSSVSFCHLISCIKMVISIFPCTDSISYLSSLKLLCVCVCPVIHPVLLGMLDRNGILSTKIVPSLEPPLFQSWVMDGASYTCLQMDVMQEALPKCPMSLITVRKLCPLIASHSCQPDLNLTISQNSLHQIFL